MSIVGNESVADDVVQTSFLHLLGKTELLQDIGRQKNSPKSLKAYLFITVSNTAKNHMKGDRISYRDDLPDIPDNRISAEDYLILKEEWQEIRNAVLLLPDRYKDAVLLRYEYHYSYSEISLLMGISVNNVGFILHRAKSQLKKTLMDKDGSHDR